MKFAGTKVHHHSSNTSYHNSLWIVLDGLELPYTVKPFRFEEMWLSNLICAKIVEAMWSSRYIVDPFVEVIRKIDKSGKELNR